MDKVEHFELPADNVERATNFYMKVFKWELNPVPGVKYTRLLTIRVDDKVTLPRPFEVNGAIIKRTKEVTTPVVTITVTDMDDTLKRIAKEGDKVLVSKTEFSDRGYTAYFSDSEGNVMGLWQVRTKP
ncbi:MAG: VOC family protein [Candidatus Bathyarchaeia archaeon]